MGTWVTWPLEQKGAYACGRFSKKRFRTLLFIPTPRFLGSIGAVRDELGENYKPNPLNPPVARKVKLGGNPVAFLEWIRRMLKRHMRKDNSM